MTRRRLAALVVTIVGAFVGIGSAWVWLTRTDPEGVQAGAWFVNLEAGSTHASMYTRARVAIKALLALERRETLYYLANRDDEGRPLRAQCRYQISGGIPAARWWSVTAYADDFFLFPNPGKRYSISGENPTGANTGEFLFVTGPAPPEDSDVYWIPTPGDREFFLTLRLYNPAPALQVNPGALAAPSIRMQGQCS